MTEPIVEVDQDDAAQADVEATDESTEDNGEGDAAEAADSAE